MTTSILNSIKKVLGLPADHAAFDEDVLMHINSIFSRLQQLGVGPANGFMVEDESVTWDAFLDGDPMLNNVKSYMYLRVRMLFDPPSNSFTLTAMERQITEFEWLINVYREQTIWTDPDPVTPVPSIPVIDGGVA